MTQTLDRILVPLDGSEPALRALDAALDIAQPAGAEVRLVTVVDVYEAELYDGLYLNPEQIEDLKGRAKEQILDPAVARCEARGVTPVVEVKVGRPLRELMKDVDNTKPSLVAMGRTGRGFFERMLEGSVSRGMVTRAPVPVLVVP